MGGRDSYNQWEAVTLTTNGRLRLSQPMGGRDSYNQWKATNPSQKRQCWKKTGILILSRKGFLYYLLIISDFFTHPPRGSWESHTPEPAIEIETIVLIFEILQLVVKEAAAKVTVANVIAATVTAENVTAVNITVAKEEAYSLPVAVRHATGIDGGGAANVPKAKDRVHERMYLDVSLPVAVRHATGIDGRAANVPEAKDRAGRQDQHLQFLRTLQEVNHLQKKLFKTLYYSSEGFPALAVFRPHYL
jgi:hypothetical protein